MSRHKNSYLSYLLMYLFWHLSWALSTQFISVYLLGKGFSAAQVALVVSGASLATRCRNQRLISTIPSPSTTHGK